MKFRFIPCDFIPIFESLPTEQDQVDYVKGQQHKKPTHNTAEDKEPAVNAVTSCTYKNGQYNISQNNLGYKQRIILSRFRVYHIRTGNNGVSLTRRIPLMS